MNTLQNLPYAYNALDFFITKMRSDDALLFTHIHGSSLTFNLKVKQTSVLIFFRFHF